MDKSISLRQKIEREYHNSKARDKERACTGMSAAYLFYWRLIGDVSGKKVLDFGCGNGWVGINLAKKGAEVSGIDISEVLVAKASEQARKEGLASRAAFAVMTAEDLIFPDNHFNMVIGSAILHHTDLDRTIKQVHRVLKPGGVAVFIEPMNQNIALRAWRRLTPWRRSPAERALVDDDLRTISGIFKDARFHFFGLSSIVTKGVLIGFPRSWAARFANGVLETVDGFLLRAFPGLGRFCAVTVMELEKRI